MIDYDKLILDKKGSPIKIAELASHHCIRCIKKMRALKKVGYKIYGAGDKVAYGTEEYDTYFVWQNKKQLEETVKFLINSGVSIITWDTEPDWPVQIIRDIINGMNKQDDVKLIVDLHDLDSIRRHVIPLPEREMFNAADGLVYVSLPIQSKTNELHKVSIPNTVLYSYCNDGIIKYEENDISKRKGIVYEGGANPPNDDLANREFSYRNLYDIIHKLVEMGNETYMFCGNITAYQTYHDIGAILYPPTEYNKMMEQLVKFKYGILIFNNQDGKKDQVNFTLTNKAQEYLQAGLPSLACWCKESEKWVEKHGIGFVFNQLDDISDCSQFENRYLEVMNNIKQKRQELVMENFIWKLENLYAEVLGVDKKGVPNNIKQLSEFEYGKEETHKLLE